MNLFDTIVRIPNNLNEDTNIELYSSIGNTSNKVYGLSIFSRGAKKWKSYIGTFPFLYGIWVNLGHSNKIYDQMNDNLTKFKMDLDDDFHGAILFNIDSNNKPINLIKSIKIDRDQWFNQIDESNMNNKYIIIENISYLYDQYENQYDDDDEEEYFISERLEKLKFLNTINL